MIDLYACARCLRIFVEEEDDESLIKISKSSKNIKDDEGIDP